MQATFSRKISNRAYLRKMHVPAAMGKQIKARCACKGCGAEFAAGAMNKVSNQTSIQEPLSLSARYTSNHVAQRCVLLVEDDKGRSWPVTFEVRVSSGQRHRRLTNGWAALCKCNGFSTGDKLALTITGAREEQGGCIGIMVHRVHDSAEAQMWDTAMPRKTRDAFSS